MVRPLTSGLHEDLSHCVFFSLLPTHCHHLYAKQCDAILWGEYIHYKNFALFIYWKARACSCQCKQNKSQYFIYYLFRIHLAGDQENGSFLFKLNLLVPPCALCQKRGVVMRSDAIDDRQNKLRITNNISLTNTDMQVMLIIPT